MSDTDIELYESAIDYKIATEDLEKSIEEYRKKLETYEAAILECREIAGKTDLLDSTGVANSCVAIYKKLTVVSNKTRVNDFGKRKKKFIEDVMLLSKKYQIALVGTCEYESIYGEITIVDLKDIENSGWTDVESQLWNWE